jgi:uncharacterized protein YbjT (DUF2867 family)
MSDKKLQVDSPSGERPPSAFVAGATGYTGLALVRALCARGFDVFAHIRPDSPRRAHWEDFFLSQGARPLYTPWREEALFESLAKLQPDFVFALIGTTRFRARAVERSGGRREDESYAQIDYGLTRKLMEAAKACHALRRFVYLSAIGASANARGGYMKARWKAEEALRGSGLPYTIVRPALISGSDRATPRPLELAGAAALDACLSVASRLGARGLRRAYQSITGDALAEVLIRLSLDPAWENRVALRGDLDKG